MAMNKHVAPVLAAVAALGIVGGVAATQAFGGGQEQPKRQVQFVQPAAETVTPDPVVTTTATATVTSAPKAPVKKAPAPVESTSAPAPAPAPVQRQAVVSEPAPETTQPKPAPQDQPVNPGSPPPVLWGSDVTAPPTSAK